MPRPLKICLTLLMVLSYETSAQAQSVQLAPLTQSPKSFPIQFSSFIDTYYMYSLERPSPPERNFTTQPVRHNEFNINLLMVTASVQKEKSRGLITLQHGNAVVKNYATEPTRGPTSGPLDSRNIQEAYVGLLLAKNMWLDAGIYLGHIGMQFESWISRDNWTYTRSMMLDHVPYYQTGLRLSQIIDAKNSWEFHLINGWQNISENNADKSIGLNYCHQFSEKFKVAYNNWIGKEVEMLDQRSTLRTYHNFIAEIALNKNFNFKGAFDLGTQNSANRSGLHTWTTSSFLLRWQLPQENKFLTFRLEHYFDKHQVQSLTLTPHGQQTIGGSVTFDWQYDTATLARLEYRNFYSRDPIYPKGRGLAKTDSFLVASLAFTL